LVKATLQDGSYPRPLLCRQGWTSLDGRWDFAFDDAEEGLPARWFQDTPAAAAAFDRAIMVPYPPESPDSGIGVRGIHPVVWYRLRIAHSVLTAESHDGSGRRVLIHFGAVDYRAQVWLDGQLVTAHEGGQTPITADITDAMTSGADEHVLVVRAEDRPFDLAQPRGKQDWEVSPHSIWYERTTGIWQCVWTETVPEQRVDGLTWTPDPTAGIVGEIILAKPPRRPLVLSVTVSLEGEVLAESAQRITTTRARLDVPIPALQNIHDRDRLLWSPESPTLLDVSVTLCEKDGEVLDSVESYVGVRSVSAGEGHFLLNDQPYFVRAVLNQGYRPGTHLATTGSAELRSEVELIKAMGFNTVRMHQKAEDPRFLHWADRLGLLVWAETAAAHEFSATAVERSVTEWLEIVKRYRGHPSIAAWVPVNESWGVPDIAQSSAQRSYALALANLTRALDPTRLVLSNEGWEHTSSDILGVHDYSFDPAELRMRYHDADVVAALVSGRGPGHLDKRVVLSKEQARAHRAGTAPLMVTEFGGIALGREGEELGYGRVGSDSEYAMLLGELFEALRSSPHLAGFCYTQFMDTAQEANGLLFDDRTPKLPIETIRYIVTAVKDEFSSR
jgi:beta-galactosidase/beta-glucuronidase